MTGDPLITRRRRRLVFAVFAVAIITSALVAIGLLYISTAIPRF